MQRALMLSILAGLMLAGAGELMAQSRTVSTADMPKPGVSYIQGPTPVRRDTVSTGSLPLPPHLYVGGNGTSGNDGYRDSRNDAYPGNDDGGNGNYSDGGYYGGGYDPGYQGSYRNGRGGRDDNHGYPGHGDHGNGGNGGNGHGDGGHSDHGRPPNTSNSLAVSTGPIKAGTPVRTSGAAFNLAPPQRPVNNRPPVTRPGNSAPPIRPAQPASNMPIRQAGWRVN